MRLAAGALLISACAKLRSQPVPPAEPAETSAMVLVSAGGFTRGHASPERADEGPSHVVQLDAFYIDRTLVTRAAYESFVGQTGYQTTAERQGYGVGAREGMADWAWERIPHGTFREPFIAETQGSDAFMHPSAPVVMVSYDDARAYCAHRGARLPTEAEWEYAMRAGAQGTRYPWGNTPYRDGKFALNFWQGLSHEKNTREDRYVYVSPVRAFLPNAWGLFDPVGNVWQWTQDWYAPDAYARAKADAKGGLVMNPAGPPSGSARVLRGGSWWCGACTCEGNGLSYRGKAEPNATFNNNGFRCARTAQSN